MGRRLSSARGTLLAGACLALLFFAEPAWTDGPFHERLERMNRRIAAQPKDATLYLERAELYRHHGDFELTLADIDRGEALDPTLVATDLLRGRAFLDAERLQEADAALSLFLAEEPDHSPALEARGRTRVALGRHLEAARDYDRAIAHQPVPRPGCYLERARALAAVGDEHLREAIAGLDAGIALMGPVVTLEQAALELELRRGATDAALERLDRAAARSPRKDTWLARRGRILEDAGRNAEARISYERALAELQRLPSSRRQTRASRDLENEIRSALERLTRKSVDSERKG
jgi:tetratricopeptide (TPR) repeat protein